MKISGRTFGTARKAIIAKIVNIYGPEPGSLPSTVAASVPRQTLRGELTDDSPRNLRFVRWLLPVSPQPIQEIILVDRLLHFGRDFSRILTHATAHLCSGGLELLSDHLRLPLQLLPGLLPGSRGKQNPQPYSHQRAHHQSGHKPYSVRHSHLLLPLDMLTLCSRLYGPSDAAHSPASREPPVGISAIGASTERWTLQGRLC